MACGREPAFASLRSAHGRADWSAHPSDRAPDWVSPSRRSWRHCVPRVRDRTCTLSPRSKETTMSHASLRTITLETVANYSRAAERTIRAYRAGGHRLIALMQRSVDRAATRRAVRVAEFAHTVDNRTLAGGLQAAAKLSLPGAQAARAMSERVAASADTMYGALAGRRTAKPAARRAAPAPRKATKAVRKVARSARKAAAEAIAPKAPRARRAPRPAAVRAEAA